ncbi:hypothetical protein [Undibacterium sp. TJN19]|uniref:hypothetical protein n=1 Tax=Undibacterium sp. TJN19 TaxID=3413055 RepID=UPI003BF179E8
MKNANGHGNNYQGDGRKNKNNQAGHADNFGHNDSFANDSGNFTNDYGQRSASDQHQQWSNQGQYPSQKRHTGPDTNQGNVNQQYYNQQNRPAGNDNDFDHTSNDPYGRNNRNGSYGQQSNQGRNPGQGVNPNSQWSDQDSRGNRQNQYGRGYEGDPDQHYINDNDAYFSQSRYNNNGRGESQPVTQGAYRDSRHAHQEGHFDPDYHQWRNQQIEALDNEYNDWRRERYQKFSDEFSTWRNGRSVSASKNEQGKSDNAKADNTSNAGTGASEITTDTKTKN